MMCLASCPPRLVRQGLFIPKWWPSPLLMFSVTSKENKCKYSSGRLLHRSGKSEVLSARVALLCSYFVLYCLFPALRSHASPRPLLWLLSHMEMPPSPCPQPKWTIAFATQLGVGIAYAGSWRSLNSSHMHFPDTKHGAYHYQIHT